MPVLTEKATSYTRALCRRIYGLELRREPESAPTADPGRGLRRLLPLTNAVADCFVTTLADAAVSVRPDLCTLLSTIISDLRELATSEDFASLPDVARMTDRVVTSVAHRFVNLCHEEDWLRKMAGVAAIRTFVEKAELPRRLILELEIDFVRALIFCLEDSPKDPHKSTADVLELAKSLIKTCQSSEDGRVRQNRLVETLLQTLNSQKELSRNAAQECIRTLSDAVGQSVPDVIGPLAKLRVLDPNSGPIFSKPLRALPFPMQVGNIDAIVYLLDLEPSLIQPTEEFTRLLHEVLALADVDDAGLLSKPVTHGQEIWLKRLRISCLKLLKSAMARQEHLGSNAPLRSRWVKNSYHADFTGSYRYISSMYTRTTRRLST
jgi:transformation/transcription domain-associated protein